MCKAEVYHSDVADIFGKMRDVLLQIADDRERFRFKNGKPNASAIAEAIGVDPSTVSRILRGKRVTVAQRHRERGVAQQYNPGPAMLDGIGRLTGCLDHGEVWDLILNAKPPPTRNRKQRS